MKEIKLTQGKVALVDDIDYHWISKYKWSTRYSRGLYYAVGWYNGSVCPMHRVMLGLKRGDGKEVDHCNGSGLDNRRSNLRICTHAENQCNRRPDKNSSSKYKGVCWHKKEQCWRSQIGHKGKNIHIGRFANEKEAAQAYDKVAKKLHGKFGCLNFAERNM